LKRLSGLSRLALKDLFKETGDAGVAENIKKKTIEFLTALADLRQLTKLDLSPFDLDGNSITILAKLSNLQELTINNNKNIDNDATKHFIGMKQLKVLYLWETGIDSKGAEHLHKLLPNCMVHFKA